jgi:hypothetical protein
MGGTAYEEFCVQILDNALPRGKRVFSGGNHDGPETEGQMDSHGYSVLNGRVIEMARLRILGDDDVMRSEFGTDIRQEGSETNEQLGVRLADTACADKEGVDILVVHEEQAAAESLARNCVSTVLSGHVHQESVNTSKDVAGSSVFQLVGDNASGTKKERPSLGPVETPATIYSIRYSKATGKALAYQTITINPDATVSIGSSVFIPQ